MHIVKAVFSSIVFVFLMATAVVNAASPYEGYTFYASGSGAYLVDMEGNIVHSWKGSGTAVCEAYLLEDGSVLFPLNNNCSTRIDGAHPSGRIQKIEWDGSITWDYSYCPSNYGPGYDIEPMPDGNVLLPADNSSSAGIIYEIKPSGDSDGEIVWQYALPDSLNSSGSSTSIPGGGTYINSVSYNPDLDYILVDLQEPVRKLVVIDHGGSGEVVYTYTAASSGRLHGAIWSSPYYIGTRTPVPDADTVAMRINNLLVVNNTSRVVEVNMFSNTLVKSISYSFLNNEGSVQRLPNGNTLVQKGMDQTTISELDDDGNEIAEITAKGRCSRAYRYGYEYPGVSRLSTASSVESGVRKNTEGISYDNQSGMCRITLPSTSRASAVVSLYTVSGSLVSLRRTTGYSLSISTDELNAGVYCVKVQHATGVFGTEFVKVR